MFKDNSMNPS